ncbi:hypothetical protein H2201_002044 [Coniosporium apollinis]|uniref:Major facilitator superfamily (MFS) profile domain-containing protein n=1 Tax=Coniosporium apollinis TaxID=61459 RepID=A0ABQ9P0R2_9PEZI|nr:hypothetical protein H2201_002044 [Coniosporium apollinis]
MSNDPEKPQEDFATVPAVGPAATEIPQQAIEGPEPPPDGGYGWVCVLSVFIINGFSWGVLASYGVCLAYYLETDLFPGATSLDYAFIGGLNFGCAMLVATPVTSLTRILGTHIPMYIGVCLQTGGFIAASFSSRIWHLYLTQGALVGVGVGFIYIPSIAITSQWFDKKRSVANGINSAGSGIGGLIFSFATRAIIDNISLGWALRITGLVSGVMNAIATSLIRNRNAIIKPPMRGFDVKLLRRPTVLLLLTWGFVSMLGYMTLLYSLPDFARSIGLSPSQAASTAAFLNLGTAVGRPLIGFMSDRFGRIRVAGLATAVSGLSVFTFWLPAETYGLTVFYSLLNGAVLGVFWMTISPLCVEVAGLAELPSLLSITWGVVILPVTFSEVIALKLRRPSFGRWEYIYPQIFAGTAYLVAAAVLFVLGRMQRRVKTPPP